MLKPKSMRRKRKPRLWGYKEWVEKVPRSKKPTTAGSAIERLCQTLGLLERLREQEAVIRWAEIVDNETARVTVAKSIKRGLLRVSVSNASARHDLLYRKEEIRSLMNRELVNSVVEDIKFS